MESDPKKILENVLHRELQKLPDLEAPATLAPRVTRAIAARSKLVWWRRSWFEWPVQVRFASVFLGVLLTGAFFSGANWLWQRALPLSATDSVTEHLQPLFEAGRVLEILGSALLLASNSLSRPVWMVSLSVIVLMYGACIALGAVTFQVVARKR